VQLVLAPGGQDDLAAGLGVQLLGQGQADARAGAGDQGHLAGQALAEEAHSQAVQEVEGQANKRYDEAHVHVEVHVRREQRRVRV